MGSPPRRPRRQRRSARMGLLRTGRPVKDFPTASGSRVPRAEGMRLLARPRLLGQLVPVGQGPIEPGACLTTSAPDCVSFLNTGNGLIVLGSFTAVVPPGGAAVIGFPAVSATGTSLGQQLVACAPATVTSRWVCDNSVDQLGLFPQVGGTVVVIRQAAITPPGLPPACRPPCRRLACRWAVGQRRAVPPRARCSVCPRSLCRHRSYPHRLSCPRRRSAAARRRHCRPTRSSLRRRAPPPRCRSFRRRRRCRCWPSASPSSA